MTDTTKPIGKPIFLQHITGPSDTVQKIAEDIFRATQANGGVSPIRYEISRDVWNTIQTELTSVGHSVESAIQNSRTVCGVPILIVEHLSD